MLRPGFYVEHQTASRELFALLQLGDGNTNGQYSANEPLDHQNDYEYSATKL
jgi:hypothetical protein